MEGVGFVAFERIRISRISAAWVLYQRLTRLGIVIAELLNLCCRPQKLYTHCYYCVYLALPCLLLPCLLLPFLAYSYHFTLTLTLTLALAYNVSIIIVIVSDCG